MLILALLVVLLWTSRHLELLNFLASWGSQAHAFCTDHVGEESQWSVIYKALTCGASLYHDPVAQTFRRLGVVHLFVFSGAHLIMAERLLFFFFKNNSVLNMGLIWLCLTSDLKAPAVRALTGRLVRLSSQRFELQWGPALSLFITGLLCLFINPKWWLGLSLPLSWVAALGIGAFPRSTIKATACVYTLCLPLLISLEPASPLAIVVNFLFSPLFFAFLLPATWLAGIAPPLQTYLDPMWTFFIDILNSLCLPVHFEIETNPVSAMQRWLYVFTLQFFCYLKERLR